MILFDAWIWYCSLKESEIDAAELSEALMLIKVNTVHLKLPN